MPTSIELTTDDEVLDILRELDQYTVNGNTYRFIVNDQDDFDTILANDGVVKSYIEFIYNYEKSTFIDFQVNYNASEYYLNQTNEKSIYSLYDLYSMGSVQMHLSPTKEDFLTRPLEILPSNLPNKDVFVLRPELKIDLMMFNKEDYPSYVKFNFEPTKNNTLLQALTDYSIKNTDMYDGFMESLVNSLSFVGLFIKLL